MTIPELETEYWLRMAELSANAAELNAIRYELHALQQRVAVALDNQAKLCERSLELLNAMAAAIQSRSN